jgi:hypothetical protein
MPTDDGLEHGGGSGGGGGSTPDPKPATTSSPGSNTPPASTPNGGGSSGSSDSDTHPFVAPPVPGGDGTKGTSVDTASLDRFADNIDKMIQPVKDAKALLDNLVAFAPGAFYDANVMRRKVTGVSQQDGLKKSYSAVLMSLITGLTDTRDGARKLSHDYGAGEDANKVTAKNLADAFEKAPGDFNAMMTANGGSAASGGGSSGAGSSSGSGGSGSGSK